MDFCLIVSVGTWQKGQFAIYKAAPCFFVEYGVKSAV